MFEPQTSFWCSAYPPQGSTFMVPGGLVYYPKDWSNKSYSDPSIAYVHTYHGLYWGNVSVETRTETLCSRISVGVIHVTLLTWTLVLFVVSFSGSFQIDDIVPEANTIAFQAGGGTQEARGTNFGAEWYIENLLEELDTPEEWWVDAVNGMIYYYPNVTTSEMIAQRDGTFKFAPNSIGTVIASQLPIILSVQGSSPSSLVNGVTLQGLTFSHTSSTFMSPMEVPSGGDWSITRIGAVRMEYVRNATVLECVWNGIG